MDDAERNAAIAEALGKAPVRRKLAKAMVGPTLDEVRLRRWPKSDGCIIAEDEEVVDGTDI